MILFEPPENIRKFLISGVFRGYKLETLDRNKSTNTCFTSCYLPEYFNYKINFRLSDEYHEVKIPYITLFCIHIKIWLVSFLFHIFLLAQDHSFMLNSQFPLISITANCAIFYKNIFKNLISRDCFCFRLDTVPKNI